MPAIKGYRAALSHVCSHAGTGVAAIKVISRMFSSFERHCHPTEIKPLEWNLALLHRSLTCLPYEFLKLSLGNLLSFNDCITKRVSELHDVSC